ncbi:MAG: ParB N-terminal domain-containing protein [Gammaproteobacteria bacterium]|nr:ParB N-terminal domain-containing protein [Gammaproteobacteria bacterium]
MSKQTNALPRAMRRKVRLEALETDEDTFQPRSGKTNALHVDYLLGVLKQGSELDALLVWEEPETKQLIVADGHHRLEAYRLAKWAKTIRIDVYRCDRDTALQLSMLENTKQKLNLYDREQRNFAWMRVMDNVWTRPMIVTGCGVSRGTVRNMREVRRKLLEMDVCIPDTWNAARLSAKGDDPDAYDDAEHMRVSIARASESFGSELANICKRWPEATGELFGKCAGDNLAKALKPLGYGLVNPFSIAADDNTPF